MGSQFYSKWDGNRVRVSIYELDDPRSRYTNVEGIILNDGTLIILGIRVASRLRRQGVGTALLNELRRITEAKRTVTGTDVTPKGKLFWRYHHVRPGGSMLERHDNTWVRKSPKEAASESWEKYKKYYKEKYGKEYPNKS